MRCRDLFRRLTNVAIAAMLVSFVTAPSVWAEAEIPVDIELVLAIDVSGSIDPEEAKLQRQGHVSALTHPKIVDAISRGYLGRIAVTYFEWAGADYRRPIANWATIQDTASAQAFADSLTAAEISIGRRTSISGAIQYAIPLFDDNGYEGTRRVIDVSGDGANNSGVLVNLARDLAIERGITINGLPIVSDRPNRFGFPQLRDLDEYYFHCVIGGTGAFIVVAHGFDAFAQAIHRKLILEIASLTPPPRGRCHPTQGIRAIPSAASPGCNIDPEHVLSAGLRCRRAPHVGVPQRPRLVAPFEGPSTQPALSSPSGRLPENCF